METLTANEARVGIYETMEEMKMRCLKEKLAQSKNDVDNGHFVDGPTFFDEMRNCPFHAKSIT